MMIDLSSNHLDIVSQILKEHAVGCEVWAYGSRVNGNARKYSDLDLVIKADQQLEQCVLLGLKDAFESSDLPFRVDVLDWNRISDEFKKRILEKYIVICSKS
jgi:predicted nucleotidyltransferase